MKRGERSPGSLFFALATLLAACDESPPSAPERDAAADGPSPIADASHGERDARALEGGTPSTSADGGDAGPPPPDPANATSYLIHPTHTNAVSGSTLVPPLTRIWTANLPGTASYPLIADGRVYIVVFAAGVGANSPAAVMAFDVASGVTLWSTSLAATTAGIAYDSGRVFTADGFGFVSAFDATTGALLWTQSMSGPNTYAFSTAVTAYRGVVYTNAGGEGGTLFAYDEATGALVFQNFDPSGGYDSPPAVEDSGIVVAYACDQTYKRDRFSGGLVWHYATGCSGGGADTPVIARGRVYVTETTNGNVTIDDASGAATGTFMAGFPPSFDDSFEVFVWGAVNQRLSQLSAMDTTTGLTVWTFAPDGVTFVLPPLLAGGHVYALDSSGKLTALDEQSGSMVWSDAYPIATVDDSTFPIQPMAAAGGVLIVPERFQLVAYGSAGGADAGSSSPPASDGGCSFNMVNVQQPAAGQGASYVAIGDLNGDGKPDLAVSDSDAYAPGTVSVLIGNGDGTFQPASAYPVGQSSGTVAIADLNGDGNPDLVVVNSGGQNPSLDVTSSVSVLLGKGDGTFEPQTTFETYMGSMDVVIADFNGDAKLDLAVANDSRGGLSVLLGNGDGTFQPSITTFDASGESLAVGDLNGDGTPDLVSVDGEYDVEVSLGNGNGTFQRDVPYPTFALPCCVTEPNSEAVGDFNRDGKLDVAVSNFGASSVSVFLGNGDGTLQTQVPYTTNSSPQAVRVGDVNGDGALDLVLTVGQSPDVSVLLGNGDGTFQPQRIFAVQGGTYSVAVADLNGDGKADIVATSSATHVGVLLSVCGTGAVP
jgi:outer membrane protein assembly factor BamB